MLELYHYRCPFCARFAKTLDDHRPSLHHPPRRPSPGSAARRSDLRADRWSPGPVEPPNARPSAPNARHHRLPGARTTAPAGLEGLADVP